MSRAETVSGCVERRRCPFKKPGRVLRRRIFQHDADDDPAARGFWIRLKNFAAFDKAHVAVELFLKTKKVLLYVIPRQVVGYSQRDLAVSIDAGEVDDIVLFHRHCRAPLARLRVTMSAPTARSPSRSWRNRSR